MLKSKTMIAKEFNHLIYVVETFRKTADLVSAVAYAQLNRNSMTKPILLDVGARGGLATKWKLVHRWGLIEPILFEPDPIEAEALRIDEPKVKIVPFALWDVDDTLELNITKALGCSSILMPDRDTMRKYGRANDFIIDHKKRVAARRFDTLAKEMGLGSPRFLKIDVQGGERHVLDGLGDALDGVIAIECECHLVRHYIGETLFPELYEFLQPNFGLVAFRPLGLAQGEIIEANAYFVRKHGLTTEGSILREFWCRLMGIPSATGYSIRCG